MCCLMIRGDAESQASLPSAPQGNGRGSCNDEGPVPLQGLTKENAGMCRAVPCRVRKSSVPRNPCRAVSGKNRAEKTMSCRASEGRAQKIDRNLDRRPTNGDGVNGDKVMVSRVAPLAPQRPARYPEAHQVQHKQQPQALPSAGPWWREAKAPPSAGPWRRFAPPIWLLFVLDLVGLWVPRPALGSQRGDPRNHNYVPVYSVPTCGPPKKGGQGHKKSDVPSQSFTNTQGL